MAAPKKSAPRKPDAAGSGEARQRRHPGLEEAWRSSEKGPGALVFFLAACALLALTLAVAGLTWGAATLGIPVFVAMPVLVALLYVGYVLLQRSVKD